MRQISRRVLDPKDARLVCKLCNRRRRYVVVRRLGDVVKKNRQRGGVQDCLDVPYMPVPVNVVVIRRAGN